LSIFDLILRIICTVLYEIIENNNCNSKEVRTAALSGPKYINLLLTMVNLHTHTHTHTHHTHTHTLL